MCVGYLTSNSEQTFYQQVFYRATASAPRILSMIAIALAVGAFAVILAKAGSTNGTTATLTTRFTQDCMMITSYSGIAGLSLLGFCMIRDIIAGVATGIAKGRAKAGLETFCEEVGSTFSLYWIGCKIGCSK